MNFGGVRPSLVPNFLSLPTFSLSLKSGRLYTIYLILYSIYIEKKSKNQDSSGLYMSEAWFDMSRQEKAKKLR